MVLLTATQYHRRKPPRWRRASAIEHPGFGDGGAAAGLSYVEDVRAAV